MGHQVHSILHPLELWNVFVYAQCPHAVIPSKGFFGLQSSFLTSPSASSIHMVSGLPHPGDGPTCCSCCTLSPVSVFLFLLTTSIYTHIHTYTPTQPCWGIHGLGLTKHRSAPRRQESPERQEHGSQRGASLRKGTHGDGQKKSL